MSFVTTPPEMLASVPSTSLSPGARFSLRDFTAEGRPVGVPWLVRLLWMLVSRCLTTQWWCPNRLRVLVLRGFGARIGTGTLIKHDVKIDWPWKLEIGNDTWIGESTWIINAEPVIIGSNTCISQAALLCSGGHDRFLFPEGLRDRESKAFSQAFLDDDGRSSLQRIYLQGRPGRKLEYFDV